MAQTPSPTPTTPRRAPDAPTLTDRLADILHRGRFVFWSLFGALVVFLVGYFVYSEVNRSRRERSTVLAEEAASQYEEWKAAEAGDKRIELEKALTEKIDLIVRKYPRQYAAQRARMVRASVLSEGGKWGDAAAEYLSLATAFPKSYLAPIALFDAAVCLEEAANASGAIEAYGKVIQGYPKSYLTPHALYSRGRLYEAAGELDTAREDYMNLSDNHSSSGWTSLAKNRILALELKGR
jgi:tetratricopeptide (TPR) repeat protein